mmetsp:Transcript_144227/g.461870  ORF Transcript_144227/g.461870 Transcript_144227/m.461870 type:complete len:490 (-) Transcript_144227:227-1696(-)
MAAADASDDADAAVYDGFLSSSSEHHHYCGNDEGFESDEVRCLMAWADVVCDPKVGHARKKEALECMCLGLRPQDLTECSRMAFVRLAFERGVVDAAVALIELGVADLSCAASNFLGDFAFNSDVGAQAVLDVFPRLERCFRYIFADHCLEHLLVLDAALLLCANIAATCPSGHSQLVPLVRPICLKIIKSPTVSDKLRGNTILLLANLSMTVGPELRALRVADALLELIVERRASVSGRSVAESVIIFLHGHEPCQEIDTLMNLNVISQYIVPIMERTIKGDEFRGMYPHLLYSARLFQVLAQCRRYAEALVANPQVIPMLLHVSREPERPLRVESDLEGRRLALEALWSLARLGFWPPPAALEPPGDAQPSVGVPPRREDALEEEEEGEEPEQGEPTSLEQESRAFLSKSLPDLLGNAHPGIRASAAGLWACVHRREVLEQLVVGQRLETARGLPSGFWRWRVLSNLYPFLGAALVDVPKTSFEFAG